MLPGEQKCRIGQLAVKTILSRQGRCQQHKNKGQEVFNIHKEPNVNRIKCYKLK